MRILRMLVVAVAVAATATATAIAPALADPPAGVTPKAGDVVGVGSDTIQNVMDQFSHDYNASHRTGPRLYSWDATDPKTGVIGGPLKFKRGCLTQPRPDGSSQGVTAVETNEGGTTGGKPCEDFARSSRDRTTSDAPYAKGGIAFTALAGDALTWSTQPKTDAPRNLTTAQLIKIYTCKVRNWKQVGGKNAAIRAFIPQTGSGTRAFFLTALGLSTSGPGSCVSDDNGLLQENQGVNPVLNGPRVIFPYSIGKYIAERYHSAKCLNSTCTAVKAGKNKGLVCKPGRGQNLFGCDSHGTMVLHTINKVAPTVGNGSKTTINPRFVPLFVRTLFEVVRYSTTTKDHIPAYLEKFFGSKGWVCTSKTAKADLLDYGFIVLPNCGTTH